MPASVAAPVRTLKPLAPKRFALQVTLDQRTHDKLRYVQSLLGHRAPSGDIAQVLDLALDASSRSRSSPRPIDRATASG